MNGSIFKIMESYTIDKVVLFPFILEKYFMSHLFNLAKLLDYYNIMYMITMLLQKRKMHREVNTKFLLYQLEDSANKLLSPWKLPSLCFACLSHFGIFIIITQDLLTKGWICFRLNIFFHQMQGPKYEIMKLNTLISWIITPIKLSLRVTLGVLEPF